MAAPHQSLQIPPRPKSPQPAGTSPFTYGPRGFLANTYPREPVETLQKLFKKPFNPNTSVANPAHTRSWFLSQLNHYGISFWRTAELADLRMILETAVRNGSVKEPLPKKVVEAERKLKAEWERRVNDFKGKLEVWMRECEGFNHAAGTVDGVGSGRSAWLAGWFLNENGERNLNEKPVIMERVKDLEALKKEVAKIEGLKVHVNAFKSIVGWEGQEFEQMINDTFESVKVEAGKAGANVPTAEAHFDLKRFMAKYFLDGGGNPAPEKTPDPVVLEAWFGGFDAKARLAEIVGRVHGLNVEWFYAGGNGSGDKAFVGWGNKPLREVELLKEWLSNQARRGSVSAVMQEAVLTPSSEQMQKGWSNVIQPHFAYCQGKPPPSWTFCLKDLVGSYLVQCPLIETHWAGEPGKMTLDIYLSPSQEPGLIAAMDFHLVKGTMIIASTEDELEALTNALLWDEEDEGDRLRGRGGRRLKPRVYSSKPHPRKLKPGRLMVEWVGRQLGEGNVEIDRDYRNLGHLDFDMIMRTGGRGELHYPSFQRLPFEYLIYKVSDEPKKQPEPWSTFCPRDEFGRKI
ncbi:hypothetical protein QBC38DRAFT_359984 [Podospora fimiseda]|uniref:Uncharacterized protein n=1 Tax=Podospora fimiseda TaxID=252190 RepID=A0AAN7H670_9PEZI|nr:hypothetical protein QBC38DRAFT_359984 [Podospora fimiseda]